MNAQGLQNGLEQLQSILDYLVNSEDEQGIDIFYGYHDEHLGWFYIYGDYPGWGIAYMGASFEEALAEAQRMRKENENADLG